MPRLETTVIRGGPDSPSLWERAKYSIRSFWLGPWGSGDRELARYFGGGPVASGVSVSEETALNYAAVWNAVNIISGAVASIPLKVFRRLPGGGKDPYLNHPLYWLLHDAPNPEMSSVTFREKMQVDALLWGNAYAEIERDVNGRPRALWPLMPYAVAPFRDKPAVGLLYRVTNPSGNQILLPAADVLHIKGPSPDGVTGYGVIRLARESLGLAIATERFGSTFFGNGATFGGVLKFPVGSGSNPQAREEFRKALEQRHQGVDRAHRFLALYDGAEYQQLGVPPEDAQFLQTRKFQIEEVARWFNLPPHKLKDLTRSTYSNIEHQAIEYVQDTLMPWCRRWEAELQRKLVADLEQGLQLVEFEIDGLLRGDAAGRAQLYRALFDIGAITPNEIRNLENLNPIEGGDVTYVPTAMTPVGRI